MSASQATAAIGTLIGRGTVSGGPYTTISEVTGISGPNASREFIDVTHMESTGGYREFIASLIEGGEITCKCNSLPGVAAQNVVKDDLNDGTKRYWEITWTDASSTASRFAGFVASVSHESEVGGKSDFSFTIKITGEIDWVYSA